MFSLKRKFRKAYWLFKSRKCRFRSIDSFVDCGFSIQGPENIILKSGVRGGKNLKLQTWESYHGKKTGFKPILILHEGVQIMDNCQISCGNQIEIGQGTLLGDNVFITDNFHGNNSKLQLDIPPLNRDLYVKGKVFIGKNVWIGRNVSIMPAVSIGSGSIIGANTVVTHSIPENSVVVGNPAKIIKRLS